MFRDYALNTRNQSDKIVSMKMRWLYVMIVTSSGFVGAFVPSLFRVDSDGIDWLVINLWVFSFLCIIISILAFIKAGRLGKLEDEIKRHESQLRIENLELEKKNRDSIKPRVY